MTVYIETTTYALTLLIPEIGLRIELWSSPSLIEVREIKEKIRGSFKTPKLLVVTRKTTKLEDEVGDP